MIISEKTRDFAEFAINLAKCTDNESAYSVAHDAADICKLSRKHHKLCEDHCNGLTYGEEYEQEEERIVNKIRDIATKYNATVKAQGDHRGATIKLALPTGVSNSFGETGLYCVPIGN